jgi:hypothetical protein
MFHRYVTIIKPIKYGTLKRNIANVELPNHERGRIFDIINATILEKPTPTNIDII